MPVAKTGGAVAALALVSVMVFGGVDAAHAADPLTLVPFNSSGATNSSLVLHGTASADAPITVTATSSGITDASYCTTTADPGGSWYCTKDASGNNQLPFGSTVFTVADGTSTPVVSVAITIYGENAPTLLSPHAGSSIVPSDTVATGYGPARGSIAVTASNGGPVCSVAVVPDTGEWNCDIGGPLPGGANGLTVTASTPGFPSDTFYSRDSATTSVTVSELTVPAVSYVMGYGTATSTATTTFENTVVNTQLYSITEPGGSGTGYVSSNPPVMTCGATSAADASGPRVCDFGALAPGVWRALSYQTLGDGAPRRQNDFFLIPETPTLAATQQGPQSAEFSGTGVTGDLVTVLDEAGTMYCSATVAAGQWNCSATATGSHTFQAFEADPSWAPYTDGSGHVAGVSLGTVLAGRSALSTTAPLTIVAPVLPPAMSYHFGNASVTITAAGDPAGDGSSITVYTVDTTGSGYEFSDYPGCLAFDSEGQGAGYYAASSEQPPTTQLCTLNDLAPGVWNIYSSQSVGGVTSSFANDYFRVPATPTITAHTVGPQQTRLSGSGTSGDIITAMQDGTPVCQITVSAASWSCSIPSKPGTHSYTASQLDQGFVIADEEETDGTVYNARSAASAPAALTVAALLMPPQAPASMPAPAPTVAPIPTLFYWVLNIVGGNGPVHAGDTVTVSSSGLPPGAEVSFELHSTPRSLGTMTVAADGSFSRTVVIPDAVEPGDHHIVVTVTPQGEVPSPHEAAITVVAAAPLAAASAADAAQQVPARTSGKHSGDIRNTPTSPSSFTHALPTIANLFENPGTLAVAVGLALAILLLAALPTEILDSTVSSNLTRFGPFLARADSWAERSTAWLNRVTHGQAASSAIMIVLSAIIFGFADPHYGFDLVSLRLTVSIVIGLYVVYYIAPRISAALIRNRWRIAGEITIQPIALVFAIIGVIVGRLLGFSPGFLIGMAIGLELAASAKLMHKARSMAVQVAVIVGLALLAWVAYSLIALTLGANTGSMWTVLVQDTLATITAEGLTGMLLGLFPITFFEGKKVWQYSKVLWAALFVVTATAFSLLVLPTAVAPDTIGESLPVWLLVLGCFTVLTLALWLYFKLTTKPEGAEQSERQKVDA